MAGCMSDRSIDLSADIDKPYILHLLVCTLMYPALAFLANVDGVIWVCTRWGRGAFISVECGMAGLEDWVGKASRRRGSLRLGVRDRQGTRELLISRPGDPEQTNGELCTYDTGTLGRRCGIRRNVLEDSIRRFGRLTGSRTLPRRSGLGLRLHAGGMTDDARAGCVRRGVDSICAGNE